MSNELRGNQADQNPTYEPPRVTVMDEAEVLKTFQITSAGTSWWG